MNREQFSSLLADIQSAEREVREQAQSEYAHDDGNVFASFDRVAAHLGISRERVLLTYALKHIDGIVSWVKGHKSQREDVRGRIKDLRMCMALLWGMVEDGENAHSSDKPIRGRRARAKSGFYLFGVGPEIACADVPHVDIAQAGDQTLQETVTCECDDCQPAKCNGFSYPFGEPPRFNCVLSKDHDGECEFEYGGKRYKQSEMLKNREELFGKRAEGFSDTIADAEAEAEAVETIRVPIRAQAGNGPIVGYANVDKSSWESNQASLMSDAKAEAERRIAQTASEPSETKPRHVIAGICWIPSNRRAELTCSCGYKSEQRVLGMPYLGEEYPHP